MDGYGNFPVNTTSDLLEKVSASYIPIKWQQELSLTALNFFSAKDGNYLISPAFFTAAHLFVSSRLCTR